MMFNLGTIDIVVRAKAFHSAGKLYFEIICLILRVPSITDAEVGASFIAVFIPHRMWVLVVFRHN